MLLGNTSVVHAGIVTANYLYGDGSNLSMLDLIQMLARIYMLVLVLVQHLALALCSTLQLDLMPVSAYWVAIIMSF